MASEERPTRVFLDTNVVFSGLLTPAGNAGRILNAAQDGIVQAIGSETVITELVRNVRSKAASQAARLATLLTSAQIEVVPDPAPDEVEPWLQMNFGTDSSVLAAAYASAVDYFCTGDGGLLRRREELERRGLIVVSPRALCDILGVEPSDRTTG